MTLHIGAGADRRFQWSRKKSYKRIIRGTQRSKHFHSSCKVKALLSIMSTATPKMQYVNLGKSGLKVRSHIPRTIQQLIFSLGFQAHPRDDAIWFGARMDDLRPRRRYQTAQIRLRSRYKRTFNSTQLYLLSPSTSCLHSHSPRLA